jgi:hypothetical protein
MIDQSANDQGRLDIADRKLRCCDAPMLHAKKVNIWTNSYRITADGATCGAASMG